ncbi:hypothetical protein [Moorena sp. SIO3H5]|uniref:hypothetical protein n=1 Tax=Moorena sp. SIO3H5 TaxID=2607834 RepID=UPI0013B8A133|nr:hypothetical protein [Moorena sp. SIO3H5]NEO69752.1 hypothetical protein [Moorena sp. SIO3H5]
MPLASCLFLIPSWEGLGGFLLPLASCLFPVPCSLLEELVGIAHLDRGTDQRAFESNAHPTIL